LIKQGIRDYDLRYIMKYGPEEYKIKAEQILLEERKGKKI
jgi:hypothetical protein